MEIQHSLVEAANFNIRLNDCQDKVTVFRAPVRTCRKILYTRKLKGSPTLFDMLCAS